MVRTSGNPLPLRQALRRPASRSVTSTQSNYCTYQVHSMAASRSVLSVRNDDKGENDSLDVNVSDSVPRVLHEHNAEVEHDLKGNILGIAYLRQ